MLAKSTWLDVSRLEPGRKALTLYTVRPLDGAPNNSLLARLTEFSGSGHSSSAPRKPLAHRSE